MKNNQLFAFWKYDMFPYVLGAEINGFCEHDYPGKDHVNINGHYYLPIKIVPSKLGHQIRVELAELEIEREQALCKVQSDYRKKLNALFYKYRFPKIT